MALAAALPQAKPNSQVGSVGQAPAAAAVAVLLRAAAALLPPLPLLLLPPLAAPLMTWIEECIRVYEFRRVQQRWQLSASTVAVISDWD